MQKHHFHPSASYSWKKKIHELFHPHKLVRKLAPISPRNSLFVFAPSYIFCTVRKLFMYSLAIRREKNDANSPNYADSVTAITDPIAKSVGGKQLLPSGQAL